MTATLVVQSGITDKKEYTLEEGRTYFIGRSRQADIVVKDQQASRRHCALQATPDGAWTIADQESSNGTYVNRHRTKTRTLNDGDLIQVGKTSFEVHLEGAAPRPEPEPAAKTPEEDTLLVGADGEMRARSTTKEPPADEPKPAERPAEAPGEAQAEPKRKETAKQEATDEDLQDLFAFLDKIETGERPKAQDDPPRREERAVAHEPPPATPARAEAEHAEKDEGPLFDLVDEAEPAPRQDAPKPDPDAKPRNKGGGLLGFLRRRKKEDK